MAEGQGLRASGLRLRAGEGRTGAAGLPPRAASCSPLPPSSLPQEAAAAGLMGKPLTAKNVEEMLAQLGLPAEFSTHSQVRR